jgi:hypothetical protein
VVTLDISGLVLTGSNNTGQPSYSFFVPKADPAVYGSYEFTFLGLAETSSAEPTKLINSTIFEPVGWSISAVEDSDKGKKFSMEFPGRLNSYHGLIT